ncbi:MAG: AAA-associated domain-containing protein [Caldisericaceae bacterium]|nr:AAA-associated domain-containing protein [Caldisericaceae bacterium]
MDDVAPLPDVEIGEIIGMLEYLKEEGGRTDIYEIADDENLEIDDLVPIIKVASLLGFVRVENGDLILTDLGKELIEGDENKRKLIFKEALKKLPAFKKVIGLLLSNPNHTIDKSDLLNLLMQEMPKDEALDTLKSLINLGRYAELIGYNPEDKEIYLDQLNQDSEEEEIK